MGLNYELPNDAITLEDPSVIALIYEKINEAVERDIKIETSFACSMLNSVASDVVWVDIIGTLFDNAIEALQGYNGPKKIWLEIGQTENKKIFIRISNTFKELTVNEINRFFEMEYSTKGKNRGVGLYNVKKTVYKHNGQILALSEERDGESAIIFEITI